MMASRQSDLTLGRRTGNRPGKDRIMSHNGVSDPGGKPPDP